MKAFLKVVFLTGLLLYGSIVCKTYLDHSEEAGFKKQYFASMPSKVLIRLALLNRNIAISQFYQFQMISHYIGFALPEDNPIYFQEPHKDGVVREAETEDKVAGKISLIIKKYMLKNIDEFFDTVRFYKLMELTLEFDPNNDFAREFGMHLSKNYDMMSKAVKVLEHIYEKAPRWDYAFDIGWLDFYCLRNYEAARGWFKKVQGFPHAPRSAFNMYQATFIFEKKFDQAVISVEEQLKQVKEPSVRKSLEEKRQWFKALSLLLKGAVMYKQKYGQNITDLKDLVQAGLIPAVPEDPIGSGFYWNRELGEPASYDNPFDLVQTRNPINVEKINVDSASSTLKNIGG